MNKKRILIPISSYGFDPTEVAIPWKQISELHAKYYSVHWNFG